MASFTSIQRISMVGFSLLLLFALSQFWKEEQSVAAVDHQAGQPTSEQARLRECMLRTSKSQEAESTAIYDLLFDGQKDGTFFEIGAYDGVHLSNTYNFEHCLKWSGLLIEVNEVTAVDLKKNRANKKNTLLNEAICDKSGVVKFLRDGFQNIMIDESAAAKADPSTIHTMPCRHLSDIFTKHKIEHIDFWSLDAEGAELQILQTVDFTKVEISSIMIECQDEKCYEERSKKGAGIHKLLIDAGYTLYARAAQSWFDWMPYGTRQLIRAFHMKCCHAPPSNIYISPKKAQSVGKCKPNAALRLGCL